MPTGTNKTQFARSLASAAQLLAQSLPTPATAMVTIIVATVTTMRVEKILVVIRRARGRGIIETILVAAMDGIDVVYMHKST
jgi:hypothetical protein